MAVKNKIFRSAEECIQLLKDPNSKLIGAYYDHYDRFLKTHLPNAIFFNTNEIETEENNWNIISKDQCRQAFATKGISINDKVVIYSDNVNAASRVAFVALWLGMKHVTVLDGGIQKWIQLGYPLGSGDHQVNQSVGSFEVESEIFNDFIISDSDDLLIEEQKNPNLVLACCRSWEEFTGSVSGYDYINELGEPLGAVYAKASKTKSDTAYLLNNDLTVKSFDKIFSAWSPSGISPEKETVFYCGTGWRASTAFLICWQAGWKNIRLFDGGNYDWFKHHAKDPQKYPIQAGGKIK